MSRLCSLLIFIVLLVGCTVPEYQSTQPPSDNKISDLLPPLTGPLPVASSALYFKSLSPDIIAQPADFLNGGTEDSKTLYISDLLEDKPGQLGFTLNVPEQRDLYGGYSGKQVPVRGLVFYPTVADNQDQDFVIPLNVLEEQDVVLPKMQRSELVKSLQNNQFPLVFFSHGFGAHVFYDVQFYHDLASQGMVVVSLFHGDLRFNDFNLMQGLRTLAFNQAVEILQSSVWASMIDFQNVGLIGVSFGGSVAAILNGGVMDDIHNNHLHKQGIKVNSMIGLVPALAYGEQTNWNFANLDVPLFLVMAEKDQSVPVVPAMELFAKHPETPVQIAMLRDEGHFVSAEKWQIAQQLTLTRLKADLLHDEQAKATLKTIAAMKNFAEAELILDNL